MDEIPQRQPAELCQGLVGRLRAAVVGPGHRLSPSDFHPPLLDVVDAVVPALVVNPRAWDVTSG